MDACSARLADGPLMSAEAVLGLRAHAVEAYPDECLGYVDPGGSYVRLDNVSPDPQRSALPDGQVFARLVSEGRIRALAHSHPGGPDCPSENDMRAQLELEVPFVIVSTNGQATTAPFAWGDQLIDDRDLVGRSFRHAVDDCYELIRASVRQTDGIWLPSYPRNWEWWSEETPGEKDLYRRYFADAGYAAIDPSQVRPGDVWLAVVGREATRANVPNHAGLYQEGGLVLHHPSSGSPHDPNRLSKREPLARWAPYVSHWLRRQA